MKACVWKFCPGSLFCNVVLSVLSIFAIMLRKRELVALLYMCSCVVWLSVFLAVSLSRGAMC